MAGSALRSARRRRGAVSGCAARVPCVLPAPADDRERRALVLGRRVARRSRVRRAVRHRRRQQRVADDRRDRLPHRDAGGPDVARGVQSLVPRVGSQPAGDRRSLRRRRRRARRRQHRSALPGDRGLGSGRFLRLHRRDPAGPDHDPGRGLHPQPRTGAEGTETDPCPGLEVHVLRHDSRRRRGHHADRAARVDARRLDPLRRGEPLRPVDRRRGLRRDGRHVLHPGVAGSVRRAAGCPLRAGPAVRPRRRRSRRCGGSPASGTDRFDRSADAHSIGSGFFDAAKAKTARNPEAGNVPITIGGLPIRNLLSFQYASRYSLNGGALHCDDMRAGCP